MADVSLSRRPPFIVILARRGVGVAWVPARARTRVGNASRSCRVRFSRRRVRGAPRGAHSAYVRWFSEFLEGEVSLFSRTSTSVAFTAAAFSLLTLVGVPPRHRRRPAFAPASRRALERYTAETSVYLRSECFDPTLPACAASFTASSRRATPATACSESSPIFAHEPMLLDANRRRVFGERGRCN